jgi:hypothetical protein
VPEPVDAAAFAEAAYRYSVFYQPTGDDRGIARADDYLILVIILDAV